MSLLWTRAAILAIAAACGPLFGCATDSSPSEAAEAAPAAIVGALPCDVDRVLSSVCQHCHSSPPRNDAPVALVTYADTQVDVEGKPLWTYMQTAVEEGRMPLPPYALTADERSMLLEWLRGGAMSAAAGDLCSAPPDGGLDD
jgi:uncharacterized membrane protein